MLEALICLLRYCTAAISLDGPRQVAVMSGLLIPFLRLLCQSVTTGLAVERSTFGVAHGVLVVVS